MEIKFTLPDGLAREAEEAGLLSQEAYAQWLNDRLEARRKSGRIDQLFRALDQIRAVPDPSAMSPEDVSAELDLMRAETRVKGLGL